MDDPRYREAVALLRHIAEQTCMDSQRFLFPNGNLLKAAVVCFLYEIGEVEYRERPQYLGLKRRRELYLKEKPT